MHTPMTWEDAMKKYGENRIRRAFTYKALNKLIQGSAADIMRLAMIKINKKLNENPSFQTKMLLQIHDELIFESQKNKSESIMLILKEIMCEVSSNEYHVFSVPLLVDINFANNWGEVH